MRACAEGQLDSVKVLVEYGYADWTLSAMVCSPGNISGCSSFFAQAAPVARGVCLLQGGLNALMWARSKGHTKIVEALEYYDSTWRKAVTATEFYEAFRPAGKSVEL